MKLTRYVGLVDIAVVIVLLIALAMPTPRMYASPSLRGTDEERYALALVEAQAFAHPKHGARVEELVYALNDVGVRDGLYKTLAIETGARGSIRVEGSPDAWRALLATSIAYGYRLDARAAHDHATRALAACTAAGASACPSWDRARMDIYHQHLTAGIEAGFVDERGRVRDVKGFREAGEQRIRMIRLGGSKN